jgi:hypothetical protein
MPTPRFFRDAVRAGDASYSVPFMVATLLAFSLAVFVLALVTDGAFRACLVMFGGLATLGALGLAAYAVAWNTGYLRLDPPQIRVREVEIVGDRDTWAEARAGDQPMPRSLAEPNRRLHDPSPLP